MQKPPNYDEWFNDNAKVNASKNVADLYKIAFRKFFIEGSIEERFLNAYYINQAMNGKCILRNRQNFIKEYNYRNPKTPLPNDGSPMIIKVLYDCYNEIDNYIELGKPIIYWRVAGLNLLEKYWVYDEYEQNWGYGYTDGEIEIIRGKRVQFFGEALDYAGSPVYKGKQYYSFVFEEAELRPTVYFSGKDKKSIEFFQEKRLFERFNPLNFNLMEAKRTALNQVNLQFPKFNNTPTPESNTNSLWDFWKKNKDNGL